MAKYTSAAPVRRPPTPAVMMADWDALTCQAGSAVPKAHALPNTLLPTTSILAWYQAFGCRASEVEPIWLQMKGQIAANRLYGSIKLVLAAVDRFFARMTPAQALTWAGAEM